MPVAARTGRPKIVLLGMMSQMPVAGVVWQNLHYLLGFERLGFDAYYVETHARTPAMLMRSEDDDSSALAAGFIDGALRRFGFGDRWAFRALHDDGRCFGLGERELHRLYDSAELLIDLHGGTLPYAELAATDRLVYLETDPVELQLELDRNEQATIEFLEPHCAFFTFAENLGNPDCRLPVQTRFPFRPTRQPVVVDLWYDHAPASSALFTTVGNWRQRFRDLEFEGDTYTWSKHHEFVKFLDLPRRAGRRFELALSSVTADDRDLLERHGWRVRDALSLSRDADAYRDYVCGSAAEFTVAKDQNVRLRTGWFSDRSATYLAAGRPVVTQDTGFGSTLPAGDGLLPFATLDEAADAVARAAAEPRRHSTAASAIAREFFAEDVVLGRLLDEVGVARARRRASGRRRSLDPFPPDLVLTPVSRRPVRLEDATARTILDRPVPAFTTGRTGRPETSVVIVTRDNLVFLRLCLEGVLAAADRPLEVIVVDNASSDDTPGYLARLAERNANVRWLRNPGNRGFAPAVNQGAGLAAGETLVLLNDDTAVTPGWLGRLTAHLGPGVGMVGPTTNRTGNEAQIDTDYRTWSELARFADQLAAERSGEAFEIGTLTMFCVAMRRAIYEQVGPLDERFEIGLLEDDDYSWRVREAGHRLLCADDAFVHHFGETSFGKLVPTGEYGRVLAANRARFERKWGAPWQPYGRRQSDRYRNLRERVRRAIARSVPDAATVLVVSRGDDELLRIDGRRAWHFPRGEDGTYAGHHPADSEEAIAGLESLRGAGADYIVFPGTGLWWLDHYEGLRDHLDRHYPQVAHEPGTAVIYSLAGTRKNGGEPNVIR